MKRIIISTLILAVLSGCSVYRKYPRTAEVDRNLYVEAEGGLTG